MKRSLLLFAMLGFGIVTYGQGCSVKPNAFTSIPVKGIEEVLNTTLLEKNAETSVVLRNAWRSGVMRCGYSGNYGYRRSLSAYTFNSGIKLTLGVDADHGSLTIRACRPDAIAYYVDGVRLRAGDITID
ncbi:MAG: hypothetical protein CFE21_01030 [Bacteroidetes bacterium B1(2017)]|nr:MAG: hypothetical protein CFE21_01030 [Bacteroidetes bacterium B1(2017)]